MANVILHPEDLAPRLRSDTIGAIHVLQQRGYLPMDTHFAFVRRMSKWGVELWKGPRHAPTGGVVWADCKEIIVAAGPLPVIRGVSEW